MITFKINFMQFKAAIQKVKNNKGNDIECIVIPIALNNLFKGEKGVYGEFVAFEVKEKRADSKDTHLVKQSLPKDVLKAMDDEAKRSLPIFGNLRVWDENQPGESTSSMEPIEENDKLPWE